ncbi:MAG: hypothetical protein WCG75_02570 [Armatimonadota bacterium]
MDNRRSAWLNGFLVQFEGIFMMRIFVVVLMLLLLAIFEIRNARSKITP